MSARDLERRIRRLEAQVGPSSRTLTDDEVIEALTNRTATLEHVEHLYDVIKDEAWAALVWRAIYWRRAREGPPEFNVMLVSPVSLATEILTYPADLEVPAQYIDIVLMLAGERDLVDKCPAGGMRKQLFNTWVRAEIVQRVIEEPTAMELRTQMDRWFREEEPFPQYVVPTRDEELRMHRLHAPIDDYFDPALLCRRQGVGTPYPPPHLAGPEEDEEEATRA